MMHTTRLLQWTAGLLLAAAPALAFAQTGPGGVGDASTNVLWLRSDAGVYSDAGTTPATNNSVVQEWHDQSGNGIVFSQTTATNQPTFLTSYVNGQPALQFDGADDWIGNTINNGSLNDNFTIFIVSRFGHLNQPNGDYDYLICVGGGYVGANRNLSISRTAGNYPSGSDRYFTFDGAKVKIDQNIPGQTWTVFSERYWTIAPRHRNWFNGALKSVPGPQVPLQTNGLFDIGRYTSGNTHHFKGEVAEVIVYNYELNDAERIIVQNYLASKYGVGVDDDKYAYDNTHHLGVIGIGHLGTNKVHPETEGSGIVGIYSPSTFHGLDFLLIGHNGLAPAFISTDVPSAMGTSAVRWDRSWRSDLTNTPGTVTLEFNLNGLSAPNPGDYELLLDADGNFSSGATQHITGRSYNAITRILTFTDVPLADGHYFTLATPSLPSAQHYASTKTQLDGGYYQPVNNKVYFQFEERYTDGNSSLDFVVLNSQRVNTGLTGSQLNSSTAQYGDNRYELDVSSLSAGTYVLEITTEKNEKRYLRFIL
ncbi:MAG: hypothetical protein ACFB10_16615 [Salibacteraceae bacterium]